MYVCVYMYIYLYIYVYIVEHPLKNGRQVRGALGWRSDGEGPREDELKEIRPYINGSIAFGDSIDLPVVASQAPGSHYGALAGAFAAPGVRIGEILLGFGCGGSGLEGGSALNCDPLPPGRRYAKLRSVLSEMGVGKDSLVEEARLESMFADEGAGGGGDGEEVGLSTSGSDSSSEGRVYHMVRGVMSGWPRSEVKVFATFVPAAGGGGQEEGGGREAASSRRRESEESAGGGGGGGFVRLDRMHFVWQMMVAAQSGLTASALIRSVSGIVAPPAMDQLYALDNLALVLSRYSVRLSDLPLPSSSQLDEDAGVNIKATLTLRYDRS